jgi:glycosyltransferase involved in cell wall biosynthesis
MKLGGMRIFMTADTVGGVWQYATDLASGLTGLGAEVTLAVLGPSPTPEQREFARARRLNLVDTGLDLDWLAPDPDAIVRVGDAVADLAARHRADVVYLNAPALAAEADFDAPVVAVAHSCVATWWEAVRGGPLPADFAWRTEMMRAGLRAADRLVAPSAAFAEMLRRRYALPQAPTVVRNGREPLTLLPRPLHDFAFTAGRLWDEGKNLRTLDRAAARLAFPLRAAGPLAGPNGTAIELAHVHLLGNLDEAGLARWLAARPVFVSAARYEPFGLAVLEAAAAGCPLVLADIPTFRELWEGAAIFVDPDDDRGFADAVDALIGDTAERLMAGQAARQRAARFTPAAMASGMASIYRELTGARGKSRAAA